MTMKPILFNTEMVQAILAGRKSQTRRVVRPPYFVDMHGEPMAMRAAPVGSYVYRKVGLMPYPENPHNPGDTLYVRETWTTDPHGVDLLAIANGTMPVYYRADYTERECEDLFGAVWYPSIHMPKEAARIFLRVTDVRVERLQDITPEDCIAEGVEKEAIEIGKKYVRAMYGDIWDSTIQKKDLDLYGWVANPWVWVYGFERASKEDAYANGG